MIRPIAHSHLFTTSEMARQAITTTVVALAFLLSVRASLSTSAGSVTDTCRCNGQDTRCAPYCPCQTETGFCQGYDNATSMQCDPGMGHAASGCLPPAGKCQCNGQKAECAPHCPCQTETGYCQGYDDPLHELCNWDTERHAPSGC